MSDYQVIKVEIHEENGVAYADLKNGDVLTIASNGLARYNGEYVTDYANILSFVDIHTVFERFAKMIEQAEIGRAHV